MMRRPRVAPVRGTAAWLLPMAIAGAAALAPADTRAAPVTFMQVKQVNSTGAADGIIRWQTVDLPAQVVPLYVANGPASDASAAFLNAGSATEAAISLDLAPGSYTFSLYGNQGTRSDDFFGIDLHFGGSNTPGISAFASFWTSQSTQPAFSVNTAAGAAGSLSYNDGVKTYTLTDFFFASGERFGNRDRTGEFDDVRDGNRDAIGQITLRVTSNVEPTPMPTPGTLALLALGLLAAGFARRARQSG